MKILVSAVRFRSWAPCRIKELANRSEPFFYMLMLIMCTADFYSPLSLTICDWFHVILRFFPNLATYYQTPKMCDINLDLFTCFEKHWDVWKYY